MTENSFLSFWYVKIPLSVYVVAMLKLSICIIVCVVFYFSLLSVCVVVILNLLSVCVVVMLKPPICKCC